MMSLATGRNSDLADDDSSDSTPVTSEMTDAVIDVLSDLLADREFGTEAARVIATLRPDPITEIGKPRHMSYDVRVVPERRRFRRQHGTDSSDPIAMRLVRAIDDLRLEGSPGALEHAVKLANSATRMSCGEHLLALTTMVTEHGSLETISTHLMLRLLFGHDVDRVMAEQCLDQLDARRQERLWEYQDNWFKWEELLVLMVFGGRPLEAAQRLLTYDRRTRNHDERTIIEALGLCDHPKSLEALELVRDRCLEERIIDQWCSAVRQIGNVRAANRLLTMLLELPEQRDWYRTRSLSEMVAELAERHPSIRERVIAIARDGEPGPINRIAGVVCYLKDEMFLAELRAIPGDRLGRLRGAMEAALRDLCVGYRPVDGSGGLSEIVPRPIHEFRARAFARASANDSGSAVCARLLQFVDELRDDYGEPAEEARHPDISLRQPWPAAAQCAWEASERLVQECGAQD